MPWWDIKKPWLFKVRKQFSDSSGKFHPVSPDGSWNWLTFANDSSQTQGWTMWSKWTWELKCNNGFVAKAFVFDKVLTDNFQACYFLNRKIWVVLKLFQSFSHALLWGIELPQMNCSEERNCSSRISQDFGERRRWGAQPSAYLTSGLPAL